MVCLFFFLIFFFLGVGGMWGNCVFCFCKALSTPRVPLWTQICIGVYIGVHATTHVQSVFGQIVMVFVSGHTRFHLPGVSPIPPYIFCAKLSLKLLASVPLNFLIAPPFNGPIWELHSRHTHRLDNCGSLGQQRHQLIMVLVLVLERG